MDEQIQRGQNWLTTLLELMGTPSNVTAEYKEEEGAEARAAWLTIADVELTDRQRELLIGQKGENIDAMQYLANTLLNIARSADAQRAFTVELNNYRVRRQSQLQELAQQIARAVRQSGQEQEIKNLSAAERRQIHTLLQNDTDLATESRGQEPDRRLVVKLR